MGPMGRRGVRGPKGDIGMPGIPVGISVGGGIGTDGTEGCTGS